MNLRPEEAAALAAVPDADVNEMRSLARAAEAHQLAEHEAGPFGSGAPPPEENHVLSQLDSALTGEHSDPGRAALRLLRDPAWIGPCRKISPAAFDVVVSRFERTAGISRASVFEHLGIEAHDPPRPRSPFRGGNGGNGRSGNNGNGGNGGNRWRSSQMSVVPAGGTQERTLLERLGAFKNRTADLPEPGWLVPDMVPNEGKVEVAASTSVGKTFLLMALALRAATLGRQVALVLEEGSPRPTGDRFRAMGFPDHLPILVAHRRGFQLGDPQRMLELEDFLRASEAPVLALDPFTSIFCGDENDTADMAEARAHLDALANINDQALLLLSHHKGRAGGKGILGGRGSSVLPAWADFYLDLEPLKTAPRAGLISFLATLVKNRDGATGMGTRVDIDLKSKTNAVRFTPVATVSGKGAGKETDGATRASRILRTAQLKPGLTLNQLATAAGGRKEITRALVAKLAAEGQLESHPQEDGRVGYHLAARAEASSLTSEPAP